jgi:hypothetical protein
MPGLFEPAPLNHFSGAGLRVTIPIILCLLLLLSRFGRSLYERVESALARLAERRVLAAGVLFLSVISVRLLALPLLPVPTPGIHDEFSYLLMADTFVHGRLTNPTHPLWMSFETFSRKLAAYLLFDESTGAGFDFGFWAIAWSALQTWMPARWAFLGAAMAALRFGVTSYWMNSYWGGAAAAIGGALVMGAVGELRKHGKARDGILLGLGLATLANSRPYEGFFFCLPAMVWFGYWLAGKTSSKAPLRVRAQGGLLPLVCVTALTVAFMGYYNWRVTNNPLLLPEMLNLRTYDSSPMFLWEEPRAKLHYNNATFEGFYNGWERSIYHTNWTDAKALCREKIASLYSTFFWPGTLLIIPGLPFTFLDRKMKVFWTTLAVALTAILAVTWWNAHYAAPLTCVLCGLIVQAIRHVRTMRASTINVGIALSRIVVVLLILDIGTHITYGVCDPLVFPCQGNRERTLFNEKFGGLPGRHLVIVRYSPMHNVHDEWVFNLADIDGSKVIWARDLGGEQNAKLLAYFRDRHVWLFEPDTDSTQMSPYQDATPITTH